MAQLYIPLAKREQNGQFPYLQELEETCSEEQIARIILLMNQAFDAGQVEALSR